MIITRIIDILSSKNVSYYYKLYNKTQWYNKQEMEQFQFIKFKKLIKHCYENVPFYTEYMNSRNIQVENITSLDQIKLFPIVTKEIIKENYEKFIPLNLKSIKGVKKGQTGGTTGNVLLKRNDANTRSSTWASFKRFKDWMGVAERDKTLILMGNHVTGDSFKNKLKKEFIDKLRNSISLDIYDISDKSIEKIVKILEKGDVKQIRTYSQFLFHFSRQMAIKGRRFDVKAITLTAEPLLPEYREVFSQVFSGEVFDQYGFGEIGGVAYECDHHEGLHITEERVYIEVNEKNELIITDLDNFAMPFIRYWNADEAILSDEACSCGRKSPLIKNILGRTSDYLIGPNGKGLHWGYVFHLLWDTEIAAKRNLLKFQVVQSEEDYLIFRTVSDPFSEEEKETIRSYLNSKMGKITVEFRQELEIENSTSGKYRPIVSKII